MFNKIKQWFNYSWSIFQARLETFSGVVLGALTVIDWEPLVGAVQSGANKTALYLTAGILVIKGLLSEFGRRQGTVTLSDGQLMPSKVNKKAEAKKVIEKKVMLAWIPIVGNILQSGLNYLNKRQDTSRDKYLSDNQVRIESGKQDVDIIRARSDVAIARTDSVTDSVFRGAIMFGSTLYFLLVCWDSCFRNLIPGYTWEVLALPLHLQFINGAVIAYLFVTAFRK